MNKSFRGISLVSIVTLTFVVSACDMFKKKGDDAGAEDATAAVDPDAGAPATPAPAAAPVATNVDDIARFPDETKLADVATTIQRFTNAREVPLSGKIVSALNKGAAVTQVAQRKEFFLIVFDNPKDPTKKVMGWVPADAFTAAPPVEAGVLKITCAVGETALIGDVPFCGKVCASDNDCPAGQACKGASNKLVNGKAAEAVRVCTVSAASTANPKLTVPTATATATTPPAPTGDIVAANAGSCPVEFVLVAKDGQCHRRCPKAGGAACTTVKACAVCGGIKVCAANDAFCK